MVGPSELGRYWRTARHLRLGQAGYWLRRRMLRPARSRNAGRGLDGAGVSLRVGPVNPGFPEWQPEWSRRVLHRREFRFLNRSFDASTSIPWPGSGLGRLWDYHLHYFDYFNLDLTSADDEPLLLDALAIAADWIRAVPSGQRPGWEPYPLSLRVVNWLKFLTRHAKRLEEIGRAADTASLLTSLVAQVGFLECNSEKDVGANHLLKNAKALVFAGTLLQITQGDRWRRQGWKLLKRELDEQILPDGGHFERSPMYHAQVLEDLLDIEALLRAWLPCPPELPGGGTAKLLHPRITAMTGWLETMVHPDGGIPLLNDCALEMGPSPRALVKRAAATTAGTTVDDAQGFSSGAPPAGRSTVRILPDTGYATIRHEASRSFLVFDCGPLGPAYQPGHGHCDLTSFELSLNGERAVVDTGTSTYEAGPVRSYERSTAAHNTLRVDGGEQAEIWSSFRVGWRPQPGRLSGGTRGALSFVQGSYADRRRRLRHARAVLCDAGGIWWFLDLVDGHGRCGVESFFHFHPRIKLSAPHPSQASRLAPPLRDDAILATGGRSGGSHYRMLGPAQAAFKLAETWYSPEFGTRLRNIAAIWQWRARLPVMAAFALAPVGISIPEIRLSPETGCAWVGKFALRLR